MRKFTSASLALAGLLISGFILTLFLISAAELTKENLVVKQKNEAVTTLANR